MKILFVDTTMDGSLVGGAHTFLVQAMTGLTGAGHEVHFISKGVPMARSSAKIGQSGAVIHTEVWDGTQIVDDATPAAARWVNKLEPDVFVVSVSPDIGWTVLPLLDPGIATLTIGHNDQETFYSPVRHYKNYLTGAIGVSGEICRKYVSECGVARDRVEWIPYGVESDENGPVTSSDGPLKLAYVGRFENEQKRIADVVKIIKDLTECRVDFTFDLVGDGEEMLAIRSGLADEIAAGHVRLHGWVESATVLSIIRNSEVFVLASAYEGFCISLIEAMANGCTPVVTDIKSGNKQLVSDGVNGFVIPVGSIAHFVDRIKVLAEDRKRLRGLRNAAWESGREYSIDRMVGNYEECFERAIADAKAHPRTPAPDFPLMESCRSSYPLWLRRIKARILNS